MVTSEYVLQDTGGKSRCPKCGWKVWLLSTTSRTSEVAFYICFACGNAYQVGVGPVRKEGGGE